MSDVYTHVSHNSLGGNLMSSIKAFFAGLIFFLVAFPILWINEGLTDMSTYPQHEPRTGRVGRARG